MNDEKMENDQTSFPDWKALACTLAVPAFANLIHFWLTVPLSWGIGVFVAFMLYHQAPPRPAGPRYVIRSLFASTGAGLVIAIGLFVSGKSP